MLCKQKEILIFLFFIELFQISVPFIEIFINLVKFSISLIFLLYKLGNPPIIEINIFSKFHTL